jgi:hypothetical protein
MDLSNKKRKQKKHLKFIRTIIEDKELWKRKHGPEFRHHVCVSYWKGPYLTYYIILNKLYFNEKN